MLAQTGFQGVDQSDPTGPSGHAYGLRISSRLTTDYRRRWRKLAVDVTPEEVIACLNEAQIRGWVLMGLHGYVGYLPMPRATQDVDVMVPYSEKRRTAQAIAVRWPTLVRQTHSQVVRFLDPADLDPGGKPKPVVGIMLPWSPFQQRILESHVIQDEESQSRYPTLEAAIVSKYAALVSPHRNWDRKQQDAVDLRRIIRANHDQIDQEKLRQLADLVWEQGGDELTTFLELALQDKPFPV